MFKFEIRQKVFQIEEYRDYDKCKECGREKVGNFLSGLIFPKVKFRVGKMSFVINSRLESGNGIFYSDNYGPQNVYEDETTEWIKEEDLFTTKEEAQKFCDDKNV